MTQALSWSQSEHLADLGEICAVFSENIGSVIVHGHCQFGFELPHFG